MYNDTIKVANKIIKEKDLAEIFQKMNEEIQICQKQYNLEKIQNEKYEREYQVWNVKNYSGKINVDVNFYDDTSISFDDYNSFMNIFYSRLHEIKRFYLRYSCSYSKKKQGESEIYISQHIYISVCETKIDIDVKISSEDNVMNMIYEFIKKKILSAPEKYDRIIRKKTSICNKVGFAKGFIPVCIILFLLLFVPTIKQIYVLSYVGYPIACLFLSFVLGTTILNNKIEKLYKNIVPEKIYAGYDSKNHKRIYKDDIDKYVETSEILIGKNVDNLKNREEIINLEKKYSKYIKYEVIALVVLSVLVVIIGKLI